MKLSALLKLAVLLAVSLLMTTNIYAQGLAKLTGKVTDKESGEELIGASVSVVSTKTGASTNVDGIYTISVQPGTYDLRASYVGYQTQVFKNVEVKAEGVSKYNIELKAETVTAEEVVVEATQSTATEGALLTQQRKATTVQDAISAELIKRTPDSDAGEAAKRITGVTVVGGKFVFVRGLGERYSSTQLNGVTIPSPEPEKKVVPFDIIPASLIENITTIKTFQPDQPGTFGGGLVRIKTKEFPDEFQLNVGVGSGFNSNAHFNTTVGYQGGKTDWIGFDDGIRNLPKSFPAGFTSLGGTTAAKEVALNALGSLSQGNSFPRATTYGPNQSYSLSLADQINLGRIPLGYIASLTYGSDAAYKDQRLFFPGTDPNGQVIYDYNQRVATYNVNWGGLLNFSTRLGENNKIGLKTTYNRAAEDETLLNEGVQSFEIEGQNIRNSRLRYIEREIFSTQFGGTHYVGGLAKSEIEWKLQYATAKRNEPDNRQTRYQKLIGDPDSTYYPLLQGGRNFRFYADLLDVERDVLLDWKIPFRQWGGLSANLKFGGLYTSKNRRFAANRYAFREGEGGFDLTPTPPEVFLTKNYVEDNPNRVSFRDETSSSDNYDAREDLIAGYVMTELPLTSQIRFIGGVRIERDTVNVSSKKLLATDREIPNGGYGVTNILPSVNFIYSFSDGINIRASYSRTVAQPEYRELAAFRFDEVLSSTIGNPSLTQTTISNFDLRWEWYPRLGELIAVSAFYKILDNPIERIVLTSGGNPLYTTANLSKSVNNIGAEFEVRKKLDFIAPITPVIKDLSISLNVTIISSLLTPKDSVQIYNPSEGIYFQPYGSRVQAKDRPLQGQSPFVINANLGYNNEELGLSAILLYNIVGRRILALSERPDQFGDFYEESRNQIDISFTKSIWRKLQAKFSVRNILDDRYKVTVTDPQRVEKDAEFYRVGRSFSIAFSYSL